MFSKRILYLPSGAVRSQVMLDIARDLRLGDSKRLEYHEHAFEAPCNSGCVKPEQWKEIGEFFKTQNEQQQKETDGSREQ